MKTIAGELSDKRLRRSILRILGENKLCSMATISPQNRVHINTAYYCHSSLDHLEIYFLSDPTAIHCKNLSETPPMAMTIFRSTQPWGTPGRGMQLFGTCTENKGTSSKES